MSDAHMNLLRAQSAMFDRVIDSIAKPAKRVARAPDAFPERPNLIAEVEELAAALKDAAKVVEIGYPAMSEMFLTRVRQGEAAAAKARRMGHV